MSLIIDLKIKAMQQSRRKKLDHFYSLCPEGGSILDVGVSRETGVMEKRLPSLNIFLKTFRHQSEDYTGLGVEDLSGMDQLYPGKRFVRYPGGRFPFEDNEFDWVFSNAVIEHVGDDDAQLQFVNEMTRVGKNVFFTTPNKYFPVESHTNVLFLHWNNKLFYDWCRKNRPRFTRKSLYLFSSKRLRSVMKEASTESCQIFKNRLLGLTMTFTVICKR
jgi:SAM-dependent methyltransferase